MRRYGVILGVAVFLLGPVAAAVAPGTNVLISRPSGLGALTTPTTNFSLITGGRDIGPGPRPSAHVVSSAEDQRYTAFVSAADGLSDADDDAVTNVYVRDRFGATILVSRADGASGAGANGDSRHPAISNSGRFVAFTSDASNLAAGAGGGVPHVYVRDLLDGSLELVDRADGPNGAIANDQSQHPAITTDGGNPVVAFESEATNLDGASAFTQIFVRTFGADDTERASLVDGTSSTPGDGGSQRPSISADATRVAFDSVATNLVAADTNTRRDVFTRTLAGTTTLLASRNEFTESDGDSYGASLSGDGTRVAFVSDAGNLAGDTTPTTIDVYVRQMGPFDLRLISRASGVAGVQGDSHSSEVALNDGGSRAVFSSRAANLDALDANGATDVFVRSAIFGGSPGTALISRPAVGAEADGESFQPSIAGEPFGMLANDRIAYATEADNMGTEDDDDFTQVYQRLTGGALLPPNPARYLSRPTADGVFASGVNASVLRTQERNPSNVTALSADGRYTVFMSAADELSDADDNRFVNIFRRDNQTGETVLVNRADGAAGAAANGPTGVLEGGGGVVVGGATVPGAPAISADGNRIAFSSAGTNLVAGDTNGEPDVFVRDIAAGTTVRVSVLADGSEIVGDGSGQPALSADGNRVAFTTGAPIDPLDGNGDNDVYLRDLAATTTTLVSRRGIGAPAGDSDSRAAKLDADGSHVVFESEATDLAPAAVTDTNMEPDVWRVEVATGAIALVNPAGGNTSNAGASNPAISADGSRITFESVSTNLGAPGDLGGPIQDVFLRDMTAGTTELISRGAVTNVSGNRGSGAPTLDASGTRVAFESNASDLVASDANGDAPDVFVRDTTAGTLELVGLTPAGAQAPVGAEAPSLSANGDCLAFQSRARSFFDELPPGTDFYKVFGRGLRGDCPFAAPAVPGPDPTPSPSPSPGPDPTPEADTTAPVLTNVRIRPKRFLAGRRVRKGTRTRRAVGGRLRFTLSEDATVIVRLVRRAKLRGRLRRSGVLGANRIAVTGTIRRKRLKPGAYRAGVRARDAAGNVSATTRVRFRILPR